MTNDKNMCEQYISDIKNQIMDIVKNVEAMVVSLLWGNPQLYLDYSNILSNDKFKYPVWRFYYSIGNKLALKDIKKIESVDVELFLQSNPKLKEAFDKYGGFEKIKDLQSICVEDNIDVYIGDMLKWDVLWNIVDKFTINSDIFFKLKDMDANQIYDYYSTLLNDNFINCENNCVVSNLQDNLKSIIDEANQGLNKGMPFNSPILSSETGGLMDGQLYLIGAGSGCGKTTFLLDCVLPSLLDFNESAVFMLNEQDDKKVKQQILTYIINNILCPSKSFNAKRWREGKFDEQEMDLLLKASKYLEDKIKDNKIIIVELKTYSRKQVERIIKKYAKLGVKKFFLDTLKISEDSTGDTFWLSLMQDVLAYSNLIKESNLNVHLTCTMQLQKINKMQRYLDNSVIGMSKSIIDTASVVILLRKFNPDEYPDEKNEVKVFEKIEGTNSTRQIPLDRNGHYQLAFITKNRNGSSEEFQICARQELGYLQYTEVGITNIMPS